MGVLCFHDKLDNLEPGAKGILNTTAQPIACSASESNLILKQAALNAAETWRSYPATRGGRPVPGTFLIHFAFRLRPKGKDDFSS